MFNSSLFDILRWIFLADMIVKVTYLLDIPFENIEVILNGGTNMVCQTFHCGGRWDAEDWDLWYYLLIDPEEATSHYLSQCWPRSMSTYGHMALLGHT